MLLYQFLMGFFTLNQGVENYDINLEEQKVTIKGNVKPDVVLDRIAKTGKATSFWTDEKTETVAPEAAVAVV